MNIDFGLKPCPFCGCEYINVNYIKEGRIFIECPKCGVETKILPEHEAIEMWNRRIGNLDAKGGGRISDYIKREDAIEIIASHDDTDGTIKVFSGRFVNGLISAIPTADVFEKDLLTDRPCAVCKYNTTEKGCTQWDCAFGM